MTCLKYTDYIIFTVRIVFTFSIYTMSVLMKVSCCRQLMRHSFTLSTMEGGGGGWGDSIREQSTPTAITSHITSHIQCTSYACSVPSSRTIYRTLLRDYRQPLITDHICGDRCMKNQVDQSKKAYCGQLFRACLLSSAQFTLGSTWV